MTIRVLQIAPIAMALCLASLAMLSSPLRAAVQDGAQSDEASDLDALSRASDDPKTGLALVREQTSVGDLTGAMATVERLLINHPDSDEAQLLHASLLCRLDDRAGASSEFSALRKRDFRGQAWKDANAPCQDAVAAAPPAATGAASGSGNTAGNATGTGDDPGKVDKNAIRNENRRRRPGL
jgi:hypothetical protein